MESVFVWPLHVWAVHFFSPSAYVDFINIAPEPLWFQGFRLRSVWRQVCFLLSFLGLSKWVVEASAPILAISLALLGPFSVGWCHCVVTSLAPGPATPQTQFLVVPLLPLTHWVILIEVVYFWLGPWGVQGQLSEPAIGAPWSPLCFLSFSCFPTDQ